MLYGSIAHPELTRFADPRLNQWIEEAVEIAKTQPVGEYPLSQTGVFVVLAAAETEPEADRKAEFHKYYADVQIVLTGCERIGYSLELEEELRAISELPKDVYFLDSVRNESFVNLQAGDFAVFLPNEIHRPLCAIDQPINVTKAIIKIPAHLF